MLNTAGKTLERLLLARLDEFLDGSPGGRSDRQFGFRRGTSTSDAITAILSFARNSAIGATQNRDLCASYCAHPRDTAEHTLFDCPRWDNARLPDGQFLGGRKPRPDDVQDLLCGSDLTGIEDSERLETMNAAADRARRAFVGMIQEIMSRKEEDERLLEQVVHHRRV